jgi:CheY-like chemotaxis protein
MSACTMEVSRPDSSRLALVVDDDMVDDDRSARRVIVDHLNELGYQTVEAASGFEAIRVAAVMKPGTIVVDGLLPNMHGFEVSRFIRASETTYAPRIIIMTAIYKNIRYRNEARLKYGIDHYLVKPVSRPALAAALEA